MITCKIPDPFYAPVSSWKVEKVNIWCGTHTNLSYFPSQQQQQQNIISLALKFKFYIVCFAAE